MKINPLFIEQILEFCGYYIDFTIRKNSPPNFVHWLKFVKKVVRQETGENAENMFHCSEKYFFSANTENENTHFISSIFFNILFISI